MGGSKFDEENLHFKSFNNSMKIYWCQYNLSNLILFPLSLQVVYQKDATKVQTKTIKAEPVKPAAAPAQEKEEEEEDDFDIDAI